MKSKGMKTVKLSEIHTNLFVRKELDQDWALTLAELIGNGVEMKDPIEVTESNGVLEIINGRHRKVAYELNDVENVKVKILEFVSVAEAVAYAYNANKGSKPPTARDTEHTIMTMERLGIGPKKIGEMIDLPAKLVQRYLEDIKSKEKRAALMKGRELVHEHNFTVPAAAQQVGVKMEELKGFLGGHRKHKSEVMATQKKLSALCRSDSAKIGRLIKGVLAQYEVGDFSKAQVELIFDKLEKSQKQQIKMVSDWKVRFTALVNCLAGNGNFPTEKLEESA